MCIRQELSPAVHTSARVASTLRILSASMAVEVSAFLTANVPPNPQHTSASGSSTRSIPATLAQQPQRPVADPQQPQRVAGRVVGDPVRVVGADVLHPEHVGQQLGQLVGAGGHRLGAAGQRLVPVAPGHHRVLVPDRAGARAGRDHDRLAALEHLHVPADQRQRLAQVAGVHVHLAAAGLRGRELHLVAEPLQQPDRGPARRRGTGCRPGRSRTARSAWDSACRFGGDRLQRRPALARGLGLAAGRARAWLDARTTRSGSNTTCRCRCVPSPRASSRSSWAAVRPSWCRGWRTEDSGTAAAAAKSTSS